MKLGRNIMLPAAALFCAVAGGLGIALSLSQGWAFLSLGFVIGMAHALEADHLTAVAAMMDRKEGPRAMIMRGAAWGLGHTLALFLICSTVILLGLQITGRTEALLELVVGTMIVGLGLRVLWKLHRDRIHIHVHDHGGERHFHAHSHAGETAAHRDSDHRHSHRAHAATMGIGLIHGAAGSAGLLVLTVAATESVAQSMAYFAVFGLGSLAGMAALTTAASYPLDKLQSGATWMRTATSLAIAGLAIWVGGGLALESLQAL